MTNQANNIAGLIPFLDAEWMRRRPYHPLSAKARRDIQDIQAARAALDKAYDNLEKAENALRDTVRKVADKRESEE